MQKLYYSISEISKLIDEEQHILRYWEKEFEHLKPRKNRAGNRIYSDRDFSLIKFIKKLLRDDKLALKDAKEEINKAIDKAGGIDLLFEENSNDLNLFTKEIKSDHTDEKAGTIASLNPDNITIIRQNLKEALDIIRKPL